ncbi:hypothetical protein JCM11641_006573 [Rhodosporidiobolus odoratus]
MAWEQVSLERDDPDKALLNFLRYHPDALARVREFLIRRGGFSLTKETSDGAGFPRRVAEPFASCQSLSTFHLRPTSDADKTLQAAALAPFTSRLTTPSLQATFTTHEQFTNFVDCIPQFHQVSDLSSTSTSSSLSRTSLPTHLIPLLLQYLRFSQQLLTLRVSVSLFPQPVSALCTHSQLLGAALPPSLKAAEIDTVFFSHDATVPVLEASRRSDVTRQARVDVEREESPGSGRTERRNLIRLTELDGSVQWYFAGKE